MLSFSCQLRRQNIRVFVLLGYATNRWHQGLSVLQLFIRLLVQIQAIRSLRRNVTGGVGPVGRFTAF